MCLYYLFFCVPGPHAQINLQKFTITLNLLLVWNRSLYLGSKLQPPFSYLHFGVRKLKKWINHGRRLSPLAGLTLKAGCSPWVHKKLDTTEHACMPMHYWWPLFIAPKKNTVLNFVSVSVQPLNASVGQVPRSRICGSFKLQASCLHCLRAALSCAVGPRVAFEKELLAYLFVAS